MPVPSLSSMEMEYEDDRDTDATITEGETNGATNRYYPSAAARQQQKKRKHDNDIQLKFMEACTAMLTNCRYRQDISEYDAVGINITKKLQRMDPSQALYAETLIHTILHRGLTNKLTENTGICEKTVVGIPHKSECVCLHKQNCKHW